MLWNPAKLTKDQLEQRRLSACDYFEKGITNCALIADKLGVARSKTHAWYQIYKEHGRDGLKQKKHQGPGKSINSEQITSIIETLKKGATEFGFEGNYWNSKRIAIVIQKSTGISYHFNHVSKLLHQWGFSYQKPEKKHTRRDEKKIADWLSETIPDLKKTKK